MATFIFNTLPELITYLTGQIGPNGDQEITGQRHQDVVVTIAQSLVNIVASIPPTTVNQFPPYNAGTVYTGGLEVVVRHSGKLWLFVSSTNQLAVTPGTNALVWQELTAVQLAHFRNQDQMLDQGGPNQVTAAELKALLGAQSTLTWKPPFDDVGATPPVTPEADFVWLVDVGATGAWAGHELTLAKWVLGAWQYTQLVDGDVTRWTGGGFIVFVTGGALELFDLNMLATPPAATLAQVLEQGRSSGPYRPILQRSFHLPPTSINHSASGTLTLDPATSASWAITLTANLTLAANSTAATGLYFIDLYGSTGTSFTFGVNSTIVVGLGVSLPSTILNGEHYKLVCTSQYVGGEATSNALVIIGCYKIN
ncbi:MAG: DUF2793 domain-containing protein [Flavobacteriales bacterium]|nr:DUF2793 domain-containing protein [Flavobacteriales bacterium]